MNSQIDLSYSDRNSEERLPLRGPSHVFKRFGERLCLLEGLGILPGGIGIGNDAGAHLDMGDAVLDDGVS